MIESHDKPNLSPRLERECLHKSTTAISSAMNSISSSSDDILFKKEDDFKKQNLKNASKISKKTMTRKDSAYKLIRGRSNTNSNASLNIKANGGVKSHDKSENKIHMTTVRPFPPPLPITPSLGSVQIIAQQLWNCPSDNFFHLYNLLQNLRYAIIFEINPQSHNIQRYRNQQNHLTNSKRNSPFQVQVLFDPGDLFLCIQRTSLRFYEAWKMHKEDLEQTLKQKQEGKHKIKELGDQKIANVDVIKDSSEESSLSVNNNESTEDHTDNLEDDDEESIRIILIEEEKLVWKLWEESMLTLATLAEECVGPAWRWQIYQRRNRSFLKNYRQKYGKNPETSRPIDTDDSISTIGMTSASNIAHISANQKNLSWNHRESISGISSGEDDDGFNASLSGSISSVLSNSNGADFAAESAIAFFVGSQSQNPLPSLNATEPNTSSKSTLSDFPTVDYPPIPEVLPAAMLRFAASVSNTILESLKTMDSIVSLPSTHFSTSNFDLQTESNEKDETKFLLQTVSEDLELLVRSEQYLLLRRQRIGDAQRRLVLALCCGERDDIENNESKTKIWKWSNEWNIAGARIPVASMFISWVETAMTGWPRKKSKTELEQIFHENDFFARDQIETNDFNDDQRNNNYTLDSKMPSAHEGQETPKSQNNIYPNETMCSLPWSELINIGEIDWCFTLKVSRAMSDLIAAQWNPPTLKNQFGTESMMGLLALAERGLNIQQYSIFGSPDDFKHDSLADDELAEEERMIAMTSSTEAMSALASLGSRGHIPSDSLIYVVSGLCRLLAAADTEGLEITDVDEIPSTKDSKNTNSFDENVKIQRKHLFLSKRESFLSDTAELLWDLIAHHKTSGTTVSVLFEIIDIDFSLMTSENLLDEEISSLLSCSGAIRAIGAAMWGNPPNVDGVKSLRIFWGSTMRVLGKVSYAIHSEILNISDTCIATSLLFDIIHEIVVSVRRVIDGEMVEANGALTPYEWEALLFTLRKGLLPWLDDYGYRNPDAIPKVVEYDSKSMNEKDLNIRNQTSLRQLICNEICEIFARIKFFCAKCSPNSGHSEQCCLHLIVDDSCRRQFHLLLLKEACPLLPPLLASNLALAVVRSWTSVECLPYRGGNWCETASELLANVFATYDDVNYGFHGACVHSPEVRLEALISMVYDEDEDIFNEAMIDLETSSNFSFGSHGEGHSTVDKVMGIFSPLHMTRNVRELHLEFIRLVLLPHLRAIALGSYFNGIQYKIDAGDSSLYKDKPQDVTILSVPPTANLLVTSIKDMRKTFLHNEYLLRRISIRLIGKLFRSVTGERSFRSSFIEILKKTILSGFSELTEDEDVTESVNLRVEAIRQLELCLGAPFRDLPHTHSSVPLIVEAICSILNNFSQDRYVVEKREVEQKMIPSHENDIFTDKIRLKLLFSAIIPLARIRIHSDGRAKYLGRSEIFNQFPKPILKCIELNMFEKPALDWQERSDGSIGCHSELSSLSKNDGRKDDDASSSILISPPSENNITHLAPFLYIHRTSFLLQQTTRNELRGVLNEFHSHNIPNQATIFSLHPIVQAIVNLFDGFSNQMKSVARTRDSNQQSDHQKIISVIRTICYRSLEAMINCDAKLIKNNKETISLEKILLKQDTSENDAYRLYEKETRCRAIVAFAGHAVRCYTIQKALQIQYKNNFSTQHLMDAEVKINSLSALLLQACMSESEHEVLYGTRGISLLLATVPSKSKRSPNKKPSSTTLKDILEIENTFDKHDFNWIVEIFKCVVNRLEQNWVGKESIHESTKINANCNERRLQNILTPDPTVPLLSVLYDILSVINDSSAFTLPTSSLWKGILACFSICCHTKCGSFAELTRQAQLLGLRCALFCVAMITTEETQKIKDELDTSFRKADFNQHIVENNLPQSNSEEEFRDDDMVKEIFYDVLRRKSICNNAVYEYHSPKSSHEHNSKEHEEIQSFPVDDNPLGDGKLEGYWLCEDSLLSLRVGNTNSRYRGWIEFIIRSSTKRYRKLFRLPDEISVGNPQIPSALWSVWGKRNTRSLEKNPIEDDSNVIMKANETILRYEIKVKQTIRNTKLVHQKAQRSRRSTKMENGGNHNQINNSPSFEMDKEDKNKYKNERLPQNLLTEINVESKNDSFTSRKQLRRFSDGDISRNESQPQMNNIHSWLESIYGTNSGNLKAIENELMSLGFEDSALGISYHPEIQSNEIPSPESKSMKALAVSQKLRRAINILDRTTHLQTHKIGLMFVNLAAGRERPFVDKNQDENFVLNDKNGSPGFLDFTQDLGSYVRCRHLTYFSGGLDTSEYASDGEFALVHISDDGDDELHTNNIGGTMMLFHALPLMPIGRNNRKKHVGNDYVHVIYVEPTNDEYNIEGKAGGSVVSGEFGFVTIFVVPLLDSQGLKITVKVKPDLGENINATLSHLSGSVVISKGTTAARYVRQIAARADLACRSVQEDRIGLFSNWEERMRQIREMIRYAKL